MARQRNEQRRHEKDLPCFELLGDSNPFPTNTNGCQWSVNCFIAKTSRLDLFLTAAKMSSLDFLVPDMRNRHLKLDLVTGNLNE